MLSERPLSYQLLLMLQSSPQNRFNRLAASGVRSAPFSTPARPSGSVLKNSFRCVFASFASLRFSLLTPNPDPWFLAPDSLLWPISRTCHRLLPTYSP